MKEYFFHFPQIKSYGNNSYHPSFIFTSCFQYNDYLFTVSVFLNEQTF